MSDITIDPFGPNYLDNVVRAMQSKEDAAYAAKVEQYKAACAEWQKNAEVAYFRGTDLPLPPARPSKVIFSSVNGALSSTVWTDPAIKTPVFVPPVTLASTGSIAATNPAPDRIDQIMAMLRVLNEKLDRLLSK